jgi:hypothetical protein
LFPPFSPPLTRVVVKEGEEELERGGGGGGGGREQDDAALIIKRGGFVRIVALEKEGALVRFESTIFQSTDYIPSSCLALA